MGPHISGAAYEVSEELLRTFVERFGEVVVAGSRKLSLLGAIRSSLVEAGVDRRMIADAGISTPTAADAWFSYRAESGLCGRHGAIAFMER